MTAAPEEVDLATAAAIAAAYSWPPLPISNRDEAADLLAERLQEAWDDLEAERIRVLTSLTMGRKDLVDRTLREFQEAIEAFRASIPAHLERFATLHLGPAYVDGVLSASPTRFMSWTAMHLQAVTSLLTDTYADFLRRSEEAGRTAEAFAKAVREAAGRELPKAAAGNRTAIQVARRLEDRLLTRYGITHVTYANGARVTVRTWATMAARTKSAVAFNSGTLNEAYATGTRFVEVFDGADCGWTTHTDGDKAHGSVRHIEDAGQFTLSHPQCQRAFGPRPDVKTKDQAKKASPSTTAEQRADQASVDWFAEARVSRSTRPAQVRRAGLAARRQARLLGASGPEQVGEIIARILRERGLG